MAVVMAGREEDQQSSLSLAHPSCCTVCSCVIVASLPCRPVGQYSVLDLRCTQPGWAADCQRRGSNLDLFSKPLTANPRGHKMIVNLKAILMNSVISLDQCHSQLNAV